MERDTYHQGELDSLPAKKYISSLLRLFKATETAQTYSEILHPVSVEIERNIGFKNVWIYLRTGNPNEFELITVHGNMESGIKEKVETLVIAGDPMMEEIVCAKSPVVVEDAQTDPRTNKEIVAQLGNRTIINAPILMVDHFMGCLGSGTFGDEGVIVLRDDQIDYFAAIASQLAVAFDRLRQYHERQHAEDENRLLSAAVKQAVDAIVITDTDGIIQYVNPAFETISEYSSNEVIGHHVRLLKSGRHSREFYEKMWETLLCGSSWQGHIVNKRKGGSFYDEEVSITPVKNAGGKVVNYVALKHDVTKEKRLERAQKYFTCVTSHELRTPLNNLQLVDLLLTELAERSKEKTIIADMRGAILSVYSSLKNIVDATETFSQFQLKNIEDSLTDIALTGVLHESISMAKEMVRREGRDIGITFDSSIKDETPCVRGDATLMQKSFNEIFSNAVKYSHDGEIIRVSVTKKDAMVLVEVSDNGKGMSEDDARLAMEPFFSLNDPMRHFTSKYKYEGGGIGLGLTITKVILEAHKGQLLIKPNRNGKGTSVTLAWPASGIKH